LAGITGTTTNVAVGGISIEDNSHGGIDQYTGSGGRGMNEGEGRVLVRVGGSSGIDIVCGWGYEVVLLVDIIHDEGLGECRREEERMVGDAC